MLLDLRNPRRTVGAGTTWDLREVGNLHVDRALGTGTARGLPGYARVLPAGVKFSCGHFCLLPFLAFGFFLAALAFGLQALVVSQLFMTHTPHQLRPLVTMLGTSGTLCQYAVRHTLTLVFGAFFRGVARH